MVSGVGASAARALAVFAFGGFIAQASPIPTSAETLLEHSAEVRMQLDFVVPVAALKTFLPAGWEPNPTTSGAGKDCNLRMIFIDRVDVTKPDGSPLGSDRLVYLAIPIKQPSTNTVGQMLIFGLTADAKQSPGGLGVFTVADKHRMERTTRGSATAPVVEEHWEFSAPSGEHMEIHLTYERGVARKGGGAVKFFSAKDPQVYQIFKTQQGLDIMRNANITVTDHVKDFQVKAGGGKIAKLFDGTERVVSVDAFHWYNREIYRP